MAAYIYDKNGYDDAKEACNQEMNDTHVCTDAELAVIAQIDSLYQGSYRYIDLSLSYNLQGQQVDDCAGFTTASATSFSHCILPIVGGPLIPHFCPCNKLLPFICCSDYNF